MPINTNVTLYSGHQVTQTLFDGVRQEVESVIFVLEPEKSYIAKLLCGMDFWLSLKIRERCMAGRCLAHLVIKKILPLQFVGPKRKYPKKYQLK